MTATYECATCNRRWDEAACVRVGPGARPLLACPTCRMQVFLWVDPAAPLHEPGDSEIVKKLAGSFAYPFSAVNLLTHTGVLVVATLVSLFPVFGGILAGGVLFGYLFAVLRATANGLDHLDTSADDIGRPATWGAPYGRLLLAALVAFGPALMAFVYVHDELLTDALLGLGALFFPAQVIVAAHGTGCLGGLNPVPTVKLILAAPGPYFLTLLFVGVATGLTIEAFRVTSALAAWPILGGLLRQWLAMLPFVAAFRMLGVLTRHVTDQF